MTIPKEAIEAAKQQVEIHQSKGGIGPCENAGFCLVAQALLEANADLEEMEVDLRVAVNDYFWQRDQEKQAMARAERAEAELVALRRKVWDYDEWLATLDSGTVVGFNLVVKGLRDTLREKTAPYMGVK